MTINKLQILFLSCLISSTVFAGRLSSYGYYGDNYPIVISISGGPAWSRPGQSQTLQLQEDIVKAYVAENNKSSLRLFSTSSGTKTLGTGEFFLGLYGNVNAVVQGQIGLALAFSSPVKVSGTIYEDGNLALNNYSYSFSIKNTRLALKGKMLYESGFYDLLPYVSGGIAAGFNRASAFKIVPLTEEEVPAPIFTNQSNTAFSYTLGFGLQTPLDTNWQLGLGYELANWGNYGLGPANYQTVGSGLSSRNLRTHELQISISYLA